MYNLLNNNNLEENTIPESVNLPSIFNTTIMATVSSYLKVLAFTFVFIACKQQNILPTEKPQAINSNNIVAELAYIESITDSTKQIARSKQLFDTLKQLKKIPWISNDTIVFLYQGSATKVQLAGDMTSWRTTADYEFKRVGKTTLWYLTKTFARDARLDYKIVSNGSWNLDTNNPHKQMSGFGYNSAFAMPDYDSSVYIIPRTNIQKGTISEAFNLNSIILNRPVRYWVYTPAGYDQLNALPSIYVVDGQEYKHAEMGAMVTVLDNMIADGLIKPVLVIFVDPVHPTTGQNQRVELFLNNASYAAFFKTELVPTVDNSYKTTTTNRAILGTSYGGNCACYFGIQIPDVFQLIAAQSPSFNSNVMTLYQQANTLPMSKVFISTGLVNDTERYADQLASTLINKQIPYQYLKVNEGHSWGNWSALLDDMLLYFYGK